MKDFICRHPIISLLMLSEVCDLLVRIFGEKDGGAEREKE